jgi:protein TonB
VAEVVTNLDPPEANTPEANGTVEVSLANSTLIALTTDPQLMDAAAGLAPAVAQVILASSTQEFIEQVLAHDGCVGLVDAGSHADPMAMVRELQQRFPAMVLVVAGSGHLLTSLAPLLANGTAFRFLHKPASSQRVQLFVEAAIRQRRELMELEGTQPMRNLRAEELRNARRLGSSRATATAVAAVMVAVLVWWVASHTGRPATRRDIGPAAAAGPATGAVAGRGGNPSTNPPRSEAAPLPQAPVEDAALTGMLEQADAALAQNRLTAANGTGTGAGELYTAALRHAPGNAHAVQGLNHVTSALLDRADRDLAAGKTDDASQRLDEAQRLEPDNPRAAALGVRLLQRREAELREQVRQASTGAKAEQLQLLLQLARRRMASGALNEPADDSATSYLNAARKLAPTDPGVRSVAQELSRRLASSEPQKPAAAPVAGVTAAVAVAADPASAAPPPAPASGASSAGGAGADVAKATDVLPEAALKRDHFVAPQYPSAAEAANTSGWVDLEFTVSRQGSVRDVAVVDAQPRGTFDAAARAAVAQWHYRPYLQDGTATERRARVRIRFALSENRK